jgi:hypothetical protein
MSKKRKDTEEEPTNRSKKAKTDPYTNLFLIHPDEIKEDFTSYEPQHKTGEKFIMNDKELMIRQITDGYDDNKETFLKKYVFVPYSIEKLPGVYMDSAYDIDRMIDMKSIRDRKGQPHGGKHKTRRRRRHRKSRKSKKSRKSRK